MQLGRIALPQRPDAAVTTQQRGEGRPDGETRLDLVGMRVPRIVFAASVNLLAVESEDAVEERARSRRDQRRRAEAAEGAGSERVPESKAERND